MASVVEHELERRLARKLRPLELVDVVHVDRRELARVRTLERNVAPGEPQLTVVLNWQIFGIFNGDKGVRSSPEARGSRSERRKTAVCRRTLS